MTHDGRKEGRNMKEGRKEYEGRNLLFAKSPVVAAQVLEERRKDGWKEGKEEGSQGRKGGSEG
jgi:hypothetical protein